MNIDILNTHSLLMAVEQLTPAKTFLRDRYFPTNTATDVFSTEDVLVDYKDGSKRLAPFVAPRKEGVAVVTRPNASLRLTSLRGDRSPSTISTREALARLCSPNSLPRRDRLPSF